MCSRLNAGVLSVLLVNGDTPLRANTLKPSQTCQSSGNIDLYSSSQTHIIFCIQVKRNYKVCKKHLNITTVTIVDIIKSALPERLQCLPTLMYLVNKSMTLPLGVFLAKRSLGKNQFHSNKPDALNASYCCRCIRIRFEFKTINL